MAKNKKRHKRLLARQKTRHLRQKLVRIDTETWPTHLDITEHKERMFAQSFERLHLNIPFLASEPNADFETLSMRKKFLNSVPDHRVAPNGATIRCRTCNKYSDRCICGKLKGEKDGLCNRSACLSPNDVKYFNHSTKRYYCPDCAQSINEVNDFEAQALFGHELCLREE